MGEEIASKGDTMTDTARYLVAVLIRCGPVTTGQLNDVSATRFAAANREKWRRHVWGELKRLRNHNVVNCGRRGAQRTWTVTEYGRLFMETANGEVG